MAKMKNWILLGVVGLVAIAAGLMLPQLLTMGNKTSQASPTETAEGEHKDDGHGKKDEKKDAHGDAAKKDGHGGDHGDKAAPATGPRFPSFGRLVVNLNDERLVRFISIDITLEVDAPNEKLVNAQVLAMRPKLRTWLTSHLADKTVDDLRGKAGINRLRREIQDEFNRMLFPDGIEKIMDVHFEEFAVQ